MLFSNRISWKPDILCFSLKCIETVLETYVTERKGGDSSGQLAPDDEPKTSRDQCSTVRVSLFTWQRFEKWFPDRNQFQDQQFLRITYCCSDILKHIIACTCQTVLLRWKQWYLIKGLKEKICLKEIVGDNMPSFAKSLHFWHKGLLSVIITVSSHAGANASINYGINWI